MFLKASMRDHILPWKTMFHSWDSPRLLVCDTGLYLEQNDISFIIVAICGGYISKYPRLGSKVIQWFTDNGMQANPSKFQFMVISPDEDCAQRLVLNENTVLVSEKQVLGVIVDSKLFFSLHVSSICKRPPAN